MDMSKPNDSRKTNFDPRVPRTAALLVRGSRSGVNAVHATHCSTSDALSSQSPLSSNCAPSCSQDR
jgi:hypothetical protein